MRLASAIEIFLNNYRNKGTRKAYRQMTDILRTVVDPEKPISAIGSVDMVQFFQHVESGPYAAATKRKHVKAAKTFFNWLVKVELLPASPARAITPRRVNTLVDRAKAMHDAELERLLTYAKFKSTARDYALLCFLADTGCRAGGAAGLKVEDLDLANELAIVTEKGSRTRQVVLFAQSVDALHVWLSQRVGDRGSFVWNRHGDPITAASISQIVRRACLRAGVRSLGSHSLRHRKGKQMAQARVNPAIAAQALGHESVLTYLQNYVGVDVKSIRDALRDLALPQEAKDASNEETPKILRLDKRA